ncbi:MAG: hypothetical protein KC443_05010 [Anaerolineales bacterium]|nr:hypothetical protein [Anaerolineales bacterium]
MSKEKATQIRSITAWMLFIAGLLLGGIALLADLLGLDFTPGFGMVQMLQLLLALTSLTLSGFIFLREQRPANAPRSLQADIGVRLAATGLVFCYVSGLSDLIGIGTHVAANEFERPFVGPLQLGGIALGIISILGGMLLYHTSRGFRQSSSMEFLVNGQEETGKKSG